TGRQRVAVIEARETYLKDVTTISHTSTVGAVAQGVRARKAPKPVATPLPPRNRRNTGQQLPTTASTAPAAAPPGGGARPRAALTATNPLPASPASVRAAASLPSVLSTLVAPMFPLPARRMSRPPDARATRNPTGMAPIR